MYAHPAEHPRRQCPHARPRHAHKCECPVRAVADSTYDKADAGSHVRLDLRKNATFVSVVDGSVAAPTPTRENTTDRFVFGAE